MRATPARFVPRPATVILMVLGVAAACALIPAPADDPTAEKGPGRGNPPPGSRFQFEVVESFDARYAGDTPGHVGRGGGLGVHPHVALGDAVHGVVHDADRVIGVVTGVTWDRVRGSLTVEFRPTGSERIAVGDDVWLDANPVGAPPVTSASP